MIKTAYQTANNHNLLSDIQGFAIVVMDILGNLQEWNKGAQKLTGIKSRTAINNNFSFLFSTEDIAKGIPTKMLKTATQKGKAQYAGYLTKGNGTIYACKLILKKLLDSNDKPIGIALIIQDLTERNIAAHKVKGLNSDLKQTVIDKKKQVITTEQRFQSIVENSFDAIALFDQSFKVLYRSPSTRRVLGLSNPLERMSNAERKKIIHPDDWSKVLAFQSALLQSRGLPMPINFRLKGSNGNYNWIEAVVNNLLDDTNVKAIVANFRNISARKLEQEKTERAKRLYAVISEINKTIVHATSEAELFSRACDIAIKEGQFDMAWIGLTDYKNSTVNMVSQSGVASKQIARFKHYKYADDKEYLTMLQTGKNVVCNEMTRLTASKHKFGFGSCCLLPIKKSGSIIGSFHLYSCQPGTFDMEEMILLSEVVNDLSFAMGNFEQIRQHNKAEESLKESEIALHALNNELDERVSLRTEDLLEANNELEAFSYTVSHDLRTPLHAIEIFGNLLDSQTKNSSPNATKNYIDSILKCTLEMNGLISDLLTFSKLGRIALVKSPLDIQKLVNDVKQNLMVTKGKKKVVFSMSQLSDVSADYTLIKSVWQNLLSNAIKYSRKDITCRITVSSKLDGNMITYKVKDNGIGFNVKYYDQLFKPFHRLHSSAGYNSGTGAGLAICERIIKKHGGEIWAETSLSKGSTFFFTLPIAQI